MHPEDQKAYEHLAQTWERLKGQRTAEQLQRLDPGDSDPPRGHPAFNPKAQENLTTLFEAYQNNGEEGLKKTFDELFPETTSPSAPASAPSTNR